MKSIVFLDLDGTLWNDEQIPPSALEAIQKAIANGHLVFTNTGRSRDAAYAGIKDLPLSGQVYSSGTEIWLNGERIFFAPLGQKRCRHLIEQLSEMGIGICSEGSEKTFSNPKAKKIFQLINLSRKAADLEGNEDYFDFAAVPDLEEMQDEDFQDSMKLSLVDLLPGSADALFEEENMVFTPFGKQDEDELLNGEITRRDLTKGTAFQIIQDYLHEPFYSIAFGDSENDLPMFEKADLAIAMGNGTDKTKEAADYVTDSLFDDGLYKAFAYAGLLEDPSIHYPLESLCED